MWFAVSSDFHFSVALGPPPAPPPHPQRLLAFLSIIISHITTTPLNTLNTEGMRQSDPSEAQVRSQAVMKAHPEGSVHYD